jgi:Na+/melibiose symporter-like transporter
MQEQMVNHQTTQQKNDSQLLSKETTNPTVNKLIKGYIIFMVAMNLIATIMIFNTYRDLSTHSDPTLPHWPFLLLSLLGLVAIAALYGLWRNQRWGFLVYLGVNLTAALITFFVLKTPPSPASLAGLALFLGVFAPRFRNMS